MPRIRKSNKLLVRDIKRLGAIDLISMSNRFWNSVVTRIPEMKAGFRVLPLKG